MVTKEALSRQSQSRTWVMVLRASACSSLDLARGLSKNGKEQKEKGPSTAWPWLGESCVCLQAT